VHGVDVAPADELVHGRAADAEEACGHADGDQSGNEYVATRSPVNVPGDRLIVVLRWPPASAIVRRRFTLGWRLIPPDLGDPSD
jgi:hypothetical protein